MAFTCLPAEAAKAFKDALKSKDIQIADLLTMTSEARLAVFEKFTDVKQAKELNLLFEEKLVLKNKVLGLKNFINKVAQEGKYSPAKKAELEQLASEYRQAQQERIFNPSEEQAFLNELADASLGTHVSRAEAKNVFDLTTKVDELKVNFDGEKWTSDKAAKEYGASKVILENYVDALKQGDISLKTLLREAIAQFKEEYKTNKPKAVIDVLLKTAKFITDNSIALVASVDNSFMGRQGLKTLMTHPTVWWEGARRSFSDIAGTLGGKNMKDALMADLYSQPNYINGTYERAGILPKSEEQYPTSLPERIWGVGRVFKASQIAFEGSAVRMRTGLYDVISEKAKQNGVDVTNKYQIESMGTMINALTARGQLGKRGESPLVRLVLWAPKMLKANIDVLTMHAGQDISPFARKEAAKNLGKIVLTSAAIITIANAIKPGSAETDPRSSDFGKIKVGNTRFDYTGGAGSLIVLASRISTLSSKSSTTGVVKKLNSGEYGSQTGLDVLVDFLAGKTPPTTGAIVAALRGADFKGEKPTLGSQIQRVTVPITIQNAIALKDDNSTSAVLGVLLDAFGINATTYSKQKTDWSQNPGVELQAFKAKVGDIKFTEANDAYNQQVADFMSTLDANAKYQALSDEDKQRVIDKKKADIKDKIFKSYSFVYKRKAVNPVPSI